MPEDRRMLRADEIEASKSSRNQKAPRRVCDHPGCLDMTAGTKPYCYRHVTLNPEAGRALKEQARRDAEVEKAARGYVYHIQPGSSVCSDIELAAKDYGKPLSPALLARQAKVPLEALKSYVIHLRARGVLRQTVNKSRIELAWVPPDERG